MPAVTNEYTVYEAYCTECQERFGGLHLGDFDNPRAARDAADEHNRDEHPVEAPLTGGKA